MRAFKVSYITRSLAAALALAHPSLSAQGVVTAQAGSASVTTLPVKSLVTVDFHDTRLDQALRIVIQQAGIELTYMQDVFPGSKRVNYQADRKPAHNVIEQLIAGTGFQVQVWSDKKISLVEKSNRNAVRGQGVIAGKVTDAKSGRGVAGASVYVGVDTRGVTTDQDGAYRMTGIAAGNQTVTVRLVGYAKQIKSVAIGEGSTITVDFKLEPSASVLDQVVVTGTVIATELKAVPNAIAVITAKQIEERGITSINQLFRGEIPGLYSPKITSTDLLDQTMMFSRGATAFTPTFTTDIASTGTSLGTNPIKTYIDGVEMADAQYLSQIDPKSIERIEILTGPQASTIYGSNAINGVMQVFTKRGTGSRPKLSLSLSSGVVQNSSNSHLAPNHLTDVGISGAEGRISYNVGGSWNYAGTWTPAKKTQRLSANGGGRLDFGKFTGDISARRGLTMNKQMGDFFQGVTDLRMAGVWSVSSTQGLPRPKKQSLLGQTLGISLGYHPFSWWSHEIVFGSDASTTETVVTAPGFGSEIDTSLSINISTISRMSERYATTMQLPVLSLAKLNFTIGGDHWRTPGMSWLASGITLTGTLGNPGVTRNKTSKNGGMFAQTQLAVKDELFFTYGVRADWNPNIGENAKVKPARYGVAYTNDVETPLGSISYKLRGSYGQSIRPPNYGHKLAQKSQRLDLIQVYGNFDAILANPNIVPEHQKGGEGGIEAYLGSRASVVVTRYNQTVDNLISLVGSTNILSGPGIDSIRSLVPTIFCSSPFRDDENHCYNYVQQYLNVASIRNQGWELQSTLNVGRFVAQGTYSWTKSRVAGVTPQYKAVVEGSTLNGSSFRKGTSFARMPEHTWNMGLTYAQSGTSIALSVNGIGMRAIQENELSLAANAANRFQLNRPIMRSLTPSFYRPLAPGYALVDLNATHRFSARIDGNLQVVNLGNNFQNDNSLWTVTTGRQSQVGARIRW